MIKFKNTRMPEDSPEINLTPLIDIIFNLLIFFLITAAITVKGINLNLPEAVSSEKLPSKSWEIIIDQEERITLNGTMIEEDRLKKIMKIEKNLPESEKVSSIIVKSDRNARFGTFVRIMDSARQCGFYDIIIATDPGRKNFE